MQKEKKERKNQRPSVPGSSAPDRTLPAGTLPVLTKPSTCRSQADGLESPRAQAGRSDAAQGTKRRAECAKRRKGEGTAPVRACVRAFVRACTRCTYVRHIRQGRTRAESPHSNHAHHADFSLPVVVDSADRPSSFFLRTHLTHAAWTGSCAARYEVPRGMVACSGLGTRARVQLTQAGVTQFRNVSTQVPDRVPFPPVGRGSLLLRRCRICCRICPGVVLGPCLRLSVDAHR